MSETIAPPKRRSPGSIPGLVLEYINGQPEGTILTPYRISVILNISPGSTTAACKSLADTDTIRVYGRSPFMVGPK